MEKKTERIQKICRDCKKPFSLTAEHMKWFEDRNLKPYTRCSECRKKKKNEEALKETNDLMLYNGYKKQYNDLRAIYDYATQELSELHDLLSVTYQGQADHDAISLNIEHLERIAVMTGFEEEVK